MAQYPGAAASDANLYVQVNNQTTFLTAGISNSDTTIPVSSTTGFPATGFVTVDLEIIAYTSIDATNFLGATRGQDGTTAVAHLTNALVSHNIIAKHHNASKDEIIAVETDLVNSLGTITPVSPAASATSIFQRFGHIVHHLRTLNDGTSLWNVAMTWLSALNQAATLAATASSLKERLDQFATQIKSITGLTNWYDAFTFLPISKGGTNSGTALNNNRIIRSTTGSIVEAAAITANRALASDANGIPTHTATTDTELGYVSGVTAAIQTQLDNKTQNILDNGGFEIWQRGTSFSNPANNSYGSDRWKIVNNETTTVTVTKETSTIDSGLASMKVLITGSTASKFWEIVQYVENYAEYRGKTVTFNVRINANTASAIKISLSDSVGTTTSSYHTGGGGWETLSVTRTLSASTTEIVLAIGMLANGDKKDGTYYFDSAMLTIGSGTVTFIPVNPATDLNRCKRYFHRFSYTTTTLYLGLGVNLSTTTGQLPYQYPVEMRVAPTITVNNPTKWNVEATGGAAQTLTALTANQSKTQSCRFDYTIGSASLTAGHATVLNTQSDATGSVDFSADF